MDQHCNAIRKRDKIAAFLRIPDDDKEFDDQ